MNKTTEIMNDLKKRVLDSFYINTKHNKETSLKKNFRSCNAKDIRVKFKISFELN
jgi:hypothetical protein